MEDQYDTEEHQPSRWEIHPGENRACCRVKRLTIKQEAFVKSLSAKAAAIEKVKPTLKRKVGYVEEVMSITRAKLAELEINKDMDTAEERGKDNNESEVNTAAR